jgi:hypothetical protein
VPEGVHARSRKELRRPQPQPKRLRRAIETAANDLRHKRYPVGTIVQVFPFEAVVKRGGGFNPSGGGWEFFNLR